MFGPNTVQNELSCYGYTDIYNVKKHRGWSADAIKNGQMVHLTLSDDGVVAIFRVICIQRNLGRPMPRKMDRPSISR